MEDSKYFEGPIKAGKITLLNGKASQINLKLRGSFFSNMSLIGTKKRQSWSVGDTTTITNVTLKVRSILHVLSDEYIKATITLDSSGKTTRVGWALWKSSFSGNIVFQTELGICKTHQGVYTPYSINIETSTGEELKGVSIDMKVVIREPGHNKLNSGEGSAILDVYSLMTGDNSHYHPVLAWYVNKEGYAKQRILSTEPEAIMAGYIPVFEAFPTLQGQEPILHYENLLYFILEDEELKVFNNIIGDRRRGMSPRQSDIEHGMRILTSQKLTCLIEFLKRASPKIKGDVDFFHKV
ncbi:MAG: putative movement protein [Artemisia capillaris nucleorhabdovirus 1]|uniref:Movement protein n=1 Tax=Artemisia capillaris nucleorhabdovirus 1 TaxID=2912606 RepID=A0AAX2ZNN2_9RHAB|nr:MAG: putative movement protein [Artemisia capillaris nucleorhabdovirus 1]UKL15218.1 MAG: putative movement protein [Artemisia capillaris nucleorhabdovirus 1]